VTLEVFEIFVKSLETGSKVQVTNETAGALSLLAKEFWLDELLLECFSVQVVSAPEVIAALSDRISKLEDQMSSRFSAIIPELTESVANHERQIQGLRSLISGLGQNLAKTRADLEELKSVALSPIMPVCPSKERKVVEFPLKDAKSIDGIISYLTRKHGGNVHDKAIVTITSKSVYSEGYALRNAADLTSDEYFASLNGPGQWVCWDFREMRIRPTHYVIRSSLLKSWVVESSLDNVQWTEIDAKTDNNDLAEMPHTASFAILKPAECRLIKLTQTGKNHDSEEILGMWAFEVFGTLRE
jgi:hypothetical protein